MSAVQSNGNKWYLFRISLVAAIGGFLFGFDTAVISGTIGFVKDEFSLSAILEGWFVSSALVGCILGVSAAGILSDKYGRKRILLLSAACSSFRHLGAWWSETMVMLIIFRIVGGIGVGIASMLSPLYISELSPAYIRGRLVALYQLAITLGILFAYFSNALVEVNSMAGHVNWLDNSTWRFMFGTETIPGSPVLCFIAVYPRKSQMADKRWIFQQSSCSAFKN